MNKKKFLFQSLIGCAALALALKWLGGKLTHASGVLREAKPTPRRVSGGTSFEEIDTFIEEQMKRLKIPGAALAVVEGDKITHLRGFGKARPGGDAPSPQTPFFIGSTTKSFTALAVMQLVEAGKIGLDAPVQLYLPWFRVADPQASARMTVRHLLNQTSGLTTVSGWVPLGDFDNHPDATQRQARELSKLKLTRPVGSAYEYSNANYNVLGLIIEAASGESYSDYIEHHIFNPLGMSHSYTLPALAKQNGLAVGHQYWFWFPIAVPNLAIPRGSLPSGQLITSSEDMARYLIAHLNGGRCGEAQILSPEGIAELHRGVAEVVNMGISAGQYGMGWFITDIGQTETVWHTGSVPDFSSYMALLPEQKKGVILLVNAGQFMMTPVLGDVGAELAALLAGQQPPPSPLSFIRFTPWATRALLLIPLLQILGVATTLRQLRHWRQDPQRRPSPGRIWGLHILLPIIPNLSLVAVPVYLWVRKMLGFMLFFFPDFSWIALICGGFAGVWTFLRTGMILRILRKSS